DGPQPGDDAVRPGADGGHRLAARAAVAEQLPVGVLLADVGGTPPFILAVVPFDQFRIDHRRRAEAGQLAGPPGALPGAGEDAGGGQPRQPFAEPDGVALAAPGQRDVGQAGVLAGEGPRGLAVPGQVDGRKRFAHDALRYDTGAGRAPQMSAAYSAMVRSLE